MAEKLCIAVLLSVIVRCLCQVPYPRPTFPDAFQTEIEGTFAKQDGVVEIDASMYFDRSNNRAAIFVTKDAELRRTVYNFDSDENLSIDSNECEVEPIEDQPLFFPFTVINGKKEMKKAEEAFFFTKSEIRKEPLIPDSIPTLIYDATIDIPEHDKFNCDLIHIFSKPDMELSKCKEGWYCNSTLITMSVKCKNREGVVDLDHEYRFTRFIFEIQDESVFFPPPGIHCDMINTKEMPHLPPYFSFTFDTIEKPIVSQVDSPIFSTHKQVWYDSKYNIIRVDEFDYTGLLYSSRIFDFKAGAVFTIPPSVSECAKGPVEKSVQLDAITRLPKSFFSQNDSNATSAVYVGKRKVHGLDYDVWSSMWSDSESSKIVEEVYILQIVPNKVSDSGKPVDAPVPQLSHVDTYIYVMDEESNEYRLKTLKYFSINNYKSKPKEWNAFDVSRCFNNNQMIEFSLKVESPPIVEGSQSYRELLEKLYNQIIAATNVSVVRIIELRGIFDGNQLLEVRGPILDNSNSSGWPGNSDEPGMEETFQLIKKAASEDELSVSILGESNSEIKIIVTSVEVIQWPTVEYPRPTFPDVFQTEIEGTYVEQDGVVEIEASMYYDRVNNRAALLVTKDAKVRRSVYNFGNDESLSISSNECDVQPIDFEPIFFPFTVINGKKEMKTAEEALFFTKSEIKKQSFILDSIPVLVYNATIDMPQYGQSNCDLTHMFSRPDVELSTCEQGSYCNSTLITMSVKCKNLEGVVDLDHVYRFSKFISEIKDESVFFPPPGIHCDMKNTKEMPQLPPYFSFTFDTIEKPTVSQVDSAIFSTHKQVWYDSKYNIIRVDEFDYDGLLYSSRIFDFKAGAAFTILASVSECEKGPTKKNVQLDVITRLPKSFFGQNDTIAKSAVYVGKRKVHGLDHDVWSSMWSASESDKIVEEVYILQVVPNKELESGKPVDAPVAQISHVDTYIYVMDEESKEYQLNLLKYFSINNYKSKPKEWAAFDVSTCFHNKQMIEFSLKVESPPIVKESQSYRELIEQLYNQIIAATSVSVVRIIELRGIFDGNQLTEIRGSILDNSKSSGWPGNSYEPGMEKTLQLIKKAASEKKLSVSFLGENKSEIKVIVKSVEEIKAPAVLESNCYSGATMAAASLVLLLIGVSFGIAGYYVFLKKKRRPANVHVRLSEIDSEHLN